MDCGWIDYVVFTETVSLCDAVDNCELTWSTLEDANWFGQTTISHNDGDAAQSGDIGNNQYTQISTNVVGPGVLEFYWKVSSEENKDYLNFYIGDSFQTQISGEGGNWQKETYHISEGLYIFSYIFPAWVSGLGMAWKIVVMAELLATSNGIGASLAVARSQLDTPTALALVVIMIGSLMFIEYIILEPIKREVELWRD